MYLPCIFLEKGGQSPFGDLQESYVVVTYNGSEYGLEKLKELPIAFKHAAEYIHCAQYEHGVCKRCGYGRYKRAHCPVEPGLA